MAVETVKGIDMRIELDKNINDWIEGSLNSLKEPFLRNVKRCDKPLVAVFEVGHVSFPVKEENLRWAKSNLILADKICKWFIRTYKRDVRLIPTVLLNNITEIDPKEFEDIVDALFEGNRYVTRDSTAFISERNMKNRAYKMIKEYDEKLDEFCENNGKMFLSTNDECMLPFGLVDETGRKIPRCGLIIASYMERIFKLSKERLHTYEKPPVLFVSFSEHDYEYERVKLGVDLYSSLNEVDHLTALVMYWSYKNGSFILSEKRFKDDRPKWSKTELSGFWNKDLKIAI